MYGEEHKSKGLDLEEIEYEDIAEEIDDEDLEEIEYADFEDETEYTDFEDETEYAEFQEADAESDYLEIVEFEDEDAAFEAEEPKKKGKQHKKEPYDAYADDDQKTSAIYIVFIALTALGVIAGNLLPLRLVSAFNVALYGMFLAAIIPPAKKDKIVAGLIVICFAASYGAAYLPVLSQMSDGTRTILLTVILSSAAAILFPRDVNKEESDNE